MSLLLLPVQICFLTMQHLPRSVRRDLPPPVHTTEKQTHCQKLSSLLADDTCTCLTSLSFLLPILDGRRRKHCNRHGTLRRKMPSPAQQEGTFTFRCHPAVEDGAFVLHLPPHPIWRCARRHTSKHGLRGAQLRHALPSLPVGAGGMRRVLVAGDTATVSGKETLHRGQTRQARKQINTQQSRRANKKTHTRVNE